MTASTPVIRPGIRAMPARRHRSLNLDPVTMRLAQSGPSERPRTCGDAALGAHEGGAGSGTADLGQAGPDRSADRAGSRERIAATGDRLMSPLSANRLWGWVGPLVVTAFAAILRFSRLSVPRAVNCDETDYIKDAWSILQHGVEWNPIANPAGYPPGQSYATVVLRPGDEAGPELGIRKWRVLAGLLIGLACAVKQDAVCVRTRLHRPVGRVGHKRATRPPGCGHPGAAGSSVTASGCRSRSS